MLSILSGCLLLLQSVFSVSAMEAPSPRHPYYVSVTEINQNAAEKSLEVSIKFFADDLEHALERAYSASLDINAESGKAMVDKYLADYVVKHLRLSADGRPLALKYLGFEKDREAVYAYFEVGGLPAVKRLDLSNDLLYDFIKEQINIMHVTVGGKRQSSKLNYPEAKVSLQF